MLERSQPLAVRTQSIAGRCACASETCPSIRHETRPAPTSNNRMPRMERMRRSSPHATNERCEPRVRRRGMRDERERGGGHVFPATAGGNRKVDAGGTDSARPQQKPREFAARSRRRPPASRRGCRQKASTRTARLLKSNRLPRPVWRVERFGTRAACDTTNELPFRSRMSESSPAERPHRSVKSSRAIALHVFTKLRARFQQKIIWVLGTCRVELNDGTNRRSQAAILRNTTRVSQSTITATGD